MKLDHINKKWEILVIDDSRLNRAIIAQTLEKLNMNVDEAEDGYRGLQALKNKKYDLVLVDIIMPNMDGFGFLERYSSVVEDSFIPVILMTGSDDLNSKIKGLRIGADDFLLKPLNEKELVARVFSLLRLKSAHTELFEKNQQIKKELEAAKRIQRFIIPKDFSTVTYPNVYGRYYPIEDIGGDYFDFYKLDEGLYGFLIADVTGHGIPAALIMSMSKMIFSIYAPLFNSTDELLNKVNIEMGKMLLAHQYITCFYLIYNDRTKEIFYTNAGHPRALFFRKKSSKVLGLDTRGLFIGISKNNLYEMKSLKVLPGDRLLLYTDGITELTDKDSEEFGEKRLANFMLKKKGNKGDSFCSALIDEIKSFGHIKNRRDDIAFINIEF